MQIKIIIYVQKKKIKINKSNNIKKNSIKIKNYIQKKKNIYIYK